MFAYKFNPNSLYDKIEITFDDVKDKYRNRNSIHINSLLLYGEIRIFGWAYNFKKELKKYIYKQNEKWNEVFAPNKTLLRNAIYGRIEKIIELK